MCDENVILKLTSRKLFTVYRIGFYLTRKYLILYKLMYNLCLYVRRF